jgi:class 3 adenylate cyclase
MDQDSTPTLSADDLMSVTREPLERLRHLQSLGLIGSGDDDRFAPQDVERVRLVQFLERRQIPLEEIARGEREASVLTSVVDFLYSRSSGQRHVLTQAADIVGLDPDVARRLREASAPSDELLDEHDVRMLAQAKVVLDAGFPEAALLQLVRVYADALGRVAEAEVRLFHFHVHEGLKATGLAGPDLLDSSKAVRDNMLPMVDPLIRYFHYRGIVKSMREDMILHLTRKPAHPVAGEASPRLRLAIVFLDLSSYTPITEVMGDAVAARIVERLSDLVRETSMRFDGRIVDRVGDAFLLVFPDPRAAVMCAMELEGRTGTEPQFPALRGAVHWGDVVYQEGGYVGGSLNLTSRVATQAEPHQILVTAVARKEIGRLDGISFVPLGRRELKGLAEELELFEVRSDTARRGERARDPVCGIEMAPGEVAATLRVDERDVAFCCARCLRLFLDAPHKYAGSSSP